MGNTPLWGVAHAVGGWGALGLRTSPTRQVGWDPAWWMGEVRKPSAPHPPTAWATPHSGVLPTPQVGRDQLPLSHKPTASVRKPLPSMTEATSMGWITNNKEESQQRQASKRSRAVVASGGITDVDALGRVADLLSKIRQLIIWGKKDR